MSAGNQTDDLELRWRDERARTSDSDPAEFDRFGTLFTPGTWAIVTRDGTRRPLSEPPVFFAGDEVTWRE